MLSDSYVNNMFQIGYRGKTVDMEQCSDRHRTSISRFLRNETLQDEPLLSSMQDLVVQKIYTEA